jgi:hypothetical protein
MGLAMSCLVIGLLTAGSALAAEPGFVEDFPAGGGLAGFFPEFILDNPGTGGVGGEGDGYLRVTQPNPANLGTSTGRDEFTGNLVADGVTGFGVYLNDVGEFDDLEIHIGLGMRQENFWLYTEGFHPPHGEWAYFEVDITDPDKWTQTQGSGSFAQAVANSNRFLTRHDLPPLVWDPDPKAGDFGIDRITVLPAGGCMRDPAWQCDGDVDGDGQVNPVDSGLVQAAFGSLDDQDICNYDVDCDGQINPVDSGIVQSLFGTCDPPRDTCP